MKVLDTNLFLFWQHYGFEITVLLSVFILFSLYLVNIYYNIEGTYDANGEIIIDDPEEQECSSVEEPLFNTNSSGEQTCRKILERIFQKPFNKIRPSFLKNPDTGRNLELDCFNEELNLALEYQGAQHYYFTPFYHGTIEGFEAQKKRDIYKRQRCNELGIQLIEVPFDIPIHKLEHFIHEKLQEFSHI